MKILAIILLILFFVAIAVFISELAASAAEEAIADMPEGPEKDKIRREMYQASYQDVPPIF